MTSQRLALGLEAGDDRLGVHPQLDDLESHAASDRLGLLRDVDDPATALADLLQQPVAPDAVARLLGEGSAGMQGRAQVRIGGRIQELALGILGLQQCLETPTEGGIAFAGTIKVGRPLPGRQFDGRVKHVRFPLKLFVHGMRGHTL